MPLMTTGGIARRAIAEQVLAGGVAIAGIGDGAGRAARPAARVAGGREPVAAMPAVAWKDKALASLAQMALVRRRLHALAGGGKGCWPPTVPCSRWCSTSCAACG
jgi:hypothetical protein